MREGVHWLSDGPLVLTPEDSGTEWTCFEVRTLDPSLSDPEPAPAPRGSMRWSLEGLRWMVSGGPLAEP